MTAEKTPTADEEFRIWSKAPPQKSTLEMSFDGI